MREATRKSFHPLWVAVIWRSRLWVIEQGNLHVSKSEIRNDIAKLTGISASQVKAMGTVAAIDNWVDDQATTGASADAALSCVREMCGEPINLRKDMDPLHPDEPMNWQKMRSHLGLAPGSEDKMAAKIERLGL